MLERHCQATLVVRFRPWRLCEMTEFKLINDHHDGCPGRLQTALSSEILSPAPSKTLAARVNEKHLQLHVLVTQANSDFKMPGD